MGVEWSYYLPTRKDVPLPLPGGFRELFTAARVLLEENAPENQIIPTLALANHLCHGVPRLVTEKEQLELLQGDEQAWTEGANRFARRFGGLRPVRIANGILILERQPVLVTVGYARTHKTSVDVVVTVYPHRAPLAAPAEVAMLYDKALSDAGLAHEERRTAHLSFAFYNSRLEITVRPGTVIKRATITEGVTVSKPGWRSDEAPFPHPHLMGELYGTLRKEFARELATRIRSRPPKSKHLVPACVAYLMECHGERRKGIHKLLNDHVVCGTGTEFKNAGLSETVQLWRNARKNSVVCDPLMDAA